MFFPGPFIDRVICGDWLDHAILCISVRVPGHVGVDGNTCADGLAKRGASMQFLRPEPFCGIIKAIPNQTALDLAFTFLKNKLRGPLHKKDIYSMIEDV